MKHGMKKKKMKYQTGIALVEVIAALGVATLAITALVSLSISTLRTSLDSKLLLEGTKIANREIELVRAYRDGVTWEKFITDIDGCDAGCYINIDDFSVVTGSIAEGDDLEAVTRKFIATQPDGSTIDPSSPPDIVRISVSVTWMIGDQEKGSYVYTDLSNWRGK